jgi:endonuclease/exonuclease/phosphatase family metal-dependent hydrolase
MKNKSNRRRIATVVILLLAAGLAWHASWRVPAGPASGTAVSGTAVSGEKANPVVGKGTIRIGSFNIHGCKGRDGRRDVDRVAECLADLDFVGLNEVRGGGIWAKWDHAEMLGRRLGRAWLFAPTSRRWYCQDFGNGLVSNVPIRFWQRIPLPRGSDYTHRNVILVSLEQQGEPIQVLITHLTRRDPAQRRAQLRAVIGLFLALDEPAILLGDLNSPPDDPLIRELLATPGVMEPFEAARVASPPGRIDWIFARGLPCVGAGILDSGASDHPLIWAEFELPP